MRKVFRILHNGFPGNRGAAGGLHNFQTLFHPNYPQPSVKFIAALRQLRPEVIPHFFVEAKGPAIFAGNQGQKYATDWGALFAALVLALIPTVVLFLIGQKQLLQGMNVGGIKG